MAELRRIYRVEHPDDERGPYMWRCDMSYGFQEMIDWHDTDDEHPAPNDTNLLCYPASGFSSMEQLRDWFDNDELAMLLSLGFVIVEIEIDADSVRYLEKQVLFKPDGIISKKVLDMSLEICYTLQS